MKEQAKIGDIIEVLPENTIYHLRHRRRYEVIEIYPKKWYNMYLCRSLTANLKTCITDQDIACTQRVINLTNI